MSDGRPTIVSRRIAYSNTVWNVFSTHVTDGRASVPDYLVVEPKTRIAGNVTGVLVLPVMDGCIGLLNIGRVAMDAMFLEAPKGFVDPGETAPDAALRELAEETGLVCAPAHVVALGSVTPEASTLAARVKLFAALACRPARAAQNDEVGLGRFDLIPVERVRVLAAEDGIEDAATVAALYRLFAKADGDPMVHAALMR